VSRPESDRRYIETTGQLIVAHQLMLALWPGNLVVFAEPGVL